MEERMTQQTFQERQSNPLLIAFTRLGMKFFHRVITCSVIDNIVVVNCQSEGIIMLPVVT